MGKGWDRNLYAMRLLAAESGKPCKPFLRTPRVQPSTMSFSPQAHSRPWSCGGLIALVRVTDAKNKAHASPPCPTAATWYPEFLRRNYNPLVRNYTLNR